MSNIDDLKYEDLMKPQYPSSAKILIRKGPKGTPWELYAECFDHGQEKDSEEDLQKAALKRIPPVEEQVAAKVKRLCKDRAVAILIVWD